MASIFTTQVPTTGTNVSDSTQYTLGVEWVSDTDGLWTGIRVYTPTTAPGAAYQVVGYQVSTSTTGSEIARGTASWASGGVWQTINFATPVAVTAGTHYIASYVTPDFFVLLSHGLDSDITNGHLTAFGSGSSGALNGRIHIAGDAFPELNASSNANYFADPVVSFTTTVTGTASFTFGSLGLSATGTVTAGSTTITGTASFQFGGLLITAAGQVAGTEKYFTPPLRTETVTIAGSLKYSFPVCSTVWKDEFGVWQHQESPSQDVLDRASLLLEVSGRPQVVSAGIAAELIAAGIGTITDVGG